MKKTLLALMIALVCGNAYAIDQFTPANRLLDAGGQQPGNLVIKEIS